MSKTTGLKAWLESCPIIDEVSEFDVNQLDPDSEVAGIYKQPTITKERLIDGSEIVTENYYLLVKKAAQLKKERIGNDEFLEQVENWVLEQEFNENYPDIGYPVYAIESNNAFYMMSRDGNDAVYQLTIAIKYERSANK